MATFTIGEVSARTDVAATTLRYYEQIGLIPAPARVGGQRRYDDAEAAFGFASPGIRSLFGTSGTFMDMVRQGYRPVYRPQVFEFREIVTLHGTVTQKVHVVGPDGRPVTAYYPMSRLPDGSWRIEGCYLQAPDEHQA